jgi:hypothetical protein
MPGARGDHGPGRPEYVEAKTAPVAWTDSCGCQRTGAPGGAEASDGRTFSARRRPHPSPGPDGPPDSRLRCTERDRHDRKGQNAVPGEMQHLCVTHQRFFLRAWFVRCNGRSPNRGAHFPTGLVP